MHALITRSQTHALPFVCFLFCSCFALVLLLLCFLTPCCQNNQIELKELLEYMLQQRRQHHASTGPGSPPPKTDTATAGAAHQSTNASPKVPLDDTRWCLDESGFSSAHECASPAAPESPRRLSEAAVMAATTKAGGCDHASPVTLLSQQGKSISFTGFSTKDMPSLVQHHVTNNNNNNNNGGNMQAVSKNAANPNNGTTSVPSAPPSVRQHSQPNLRRSWVPGKCYVATQAHSPSGPPHMQLQYMDIAAVNANALLPLSPDPLAKGDSSITRRHSVDPHATNTHRHRQQQQQQQQPNNGVALSMSTTLAANLSTPTTCAQEGSRGHPTQAREPQGARARAVRFASATTLRHHPHPQHSNLVPHQTARAAVFNTNLSAAVHTDPRAELGYGQQVAPPSLLSRGVGLSAAIACLSLHLLLLVLTAALGLVSGTLSRHSSTAEISSTSHKDRASRWRFPPNFVWRVVILASAIPAKVGPQKPVCLCVCLCACVCMRMCMHAHLCLSTPLGPSVCADEPTLIHVSAALHPRLS